MRRVLYWMPVFVAIMSFTIPAATIYGQDDKESAETETAQVEQESVDMGGQELFEELSGQHESLMEAFAERSSAAREKYNDAEDEEKAAIVEEMQTAQKELMKTANEIAGKMLELAALETTGKPVAFNSLMWVLENSQGNDERAAAVELMVKNHLDNPEIAGAIPSFTSGFPSQATEDLLVQLAEQGGTDQVKGVATISLISYLRENKDAVSGLIDNAQFAEQYPDSIEYFRKLAATDDERIKGLLTQASETFADVEYQGSTIGEMAAKELKKILIAESLQIGKVAPDIEGPDLDGTTFKLSDYRGKVVMIDFWGDW